MNRLFVTLLSVIHLAACHSGAAVDRPLASPLSVADIKNHRADLRGQRIRISGYIFQEPANIYERKPSGFFFLVQGSPNPDLAPPFEEACFGPESSGRVWFENDEVKSRWNEIRADLGVLGYIDEDFLIDAGRFITVEGIFDDENITYADENGVPRNSFGTEGMMISGPYLGMGPLTDVHIVEISDRFCSGYIRNGR